MNAEPGLVSVVIATRNRRPFLEEAITSVLAQTYAPWELIVVDDFSADDTAEFLAAFSHLRVRSIRLPQHGERSTARNRGLADASGDLVMFLDDDDTLRPTALQTLAPPLLADPEAVASVGRRFRYNENGGGAIRHPSEPMKLQIEEDLLCGWSSVSGQNLYRTAIVRSVGGYDPRYSGPEDRELWLKLAARGPVLVQPEIVMNYRVHPGQADRGVEARRNAMFRDYIATLPPEQRRRAQRIQKSGEDRWYAQKRRKQGRRLRALFLAVRSILRYPAVLDSPLLGLLMRDIFWSTIPAPLARVIGKLRGSRA